MKIVLVVDRYPPRPHTGIGTFVQTLGHGLAGRGHTVTVVEIGENFDQRLDGPIAVITLPRNKWRYVGNFITRLRLRNWLRSRVVAGAIDVVEVPDYPGFLPVGIKGCTSVIRLHQSCTVSHALCGAKIPKGVSLYEKHTLRSSPHWIGVSGHILKLTEQVFAVSPVHSAVIPNPLPRIPDSLPKSTKLPARFVLYASQVSGRKGAFVLAMAARDFLTTHKDVHLVYVGGCLPEEPGIDAQAKILGIVGSELATRVHFMGQVSRDQVLACMRACDVFAFPTQIDSFGLVVLEAMYSGAPVIFTKNPPGPEIIRDGVDGLLADPVSPQDLSQQITRVLDDSALASRLAENARRRVMEHFTLEKCVDATVRFYEECIHHNSASYERH